MVSHCPHVHVDRYDELQAKAEREIPVVVLEPGQGERPFISTTPTRWAPGQAARSTAR